jgi:hypothetical protein
MTRRKEITFAVGAIAIAALVIGLGAAGAVAATSLLSPEEESKAIIDDAAEQLGVEPAELSDALKQALKNRVDEGIEAGRLTEEQGAELKERIDSDDHLLIFGGRGLHGGPGFERHLHLMGLEAAAAYLGMTGAELRDALHDSTLAEIAREQGKTVDGLVKAIVADKTKRIDEAVANGRLTDEQGSDLKARLTEHVEALVNGERGGEFRGWHHGHRQGSWSPRAPPAFSGPSA